MLFKVIFKYLCGKSSVGLIKFSWSSMNRNLYLFCQAVVTWPAIHHFHSRRERVSGAELLRTPSFRAGLISSIYYEKSFGVWDTNEASAPSSVLQFLWSGIFPGVWSHQISQSNVNFFFNLVYPWLHMTYVDAVWKCQMEKTSTSV